jgi:hypothetical protein
VTQGILWAVLQEPLTLDRTYPNGEPHHVTLIYGAYRSIWEGWIGQEIEAMPYRLAQNDRVQALAIELEDGVPCINQIPHITISWADDAEPVESNELLANRFNTPGYIEQPWLDNTPLRLRIEFHEWSEEVRSEVTLPGEESV